MIQFRGSYPTFKSNLIWKARAKNKYKVFAWILVQKVRTADNLHLRGWPHHDHYVLCDGPLETCVHLSLLCPFTITVWSQILTWENFDNHLIQSCSWWEEAAAKVTKEERRRFNGLVIYISWNLWKKRNKNIQQRPRIVAAGRC